RKIRRHLCRADKRPRPIQRGPFEPTTRDQNVVFAVKPENVASRIGHILEAGTRNLFIFRLALRLDQLLRAVDYVNRPNLCFFPAFLERGLLFVCFGWWTLSLVLAGD